MPDTPTIVDVTAAVIKSKAKTKGEADAGLDVLSFIVRQQERDRDFFDRIQNQWQDQARAEVVAMRHGINAAVARCDRLGTTRSYEDCLEEIMVAMDNARYHGPIRDFYIEQERKARETNAGDQRTPWPAYQLPYGRGSM